MSISNLWNGYVKLKLGSANATGIIADTSPSPTEDDNGRQGWLWTKGAGAGDKLNYYMYQGLYDTATVKNLQSLFMLGTIEDWTGLSNEMPLFVVYTKPTGVGDIIPGFAHSSRAYTCRLNHNIIRAGEKCVFHALASPEIDFLGAREISYTVHTDLGDFEDNMEIAYITLHTDSGAVATSILVQHMGFKLNQYTQTTKQTQINIKLIA